MNDEGVGIAGWLLADMTLVLALLFLSLVPSGGAPGASGVPEIRGLGCSSADRVLICDPEIEGVGPFEYSWAISASGQREDAAHAATGGLRARFDGPGWVSLVVSGAHGASAERFHGFDAPAATGSLPEADFSFDQLVLDARDRSPEGLASAIASARIREGLSKDDEDAVAWDAADAGSAAAWLDGKRRACLRIALVETFSRPGGGPDRAAGRGVDLSRAVNEAFFAWPGVAGSFHASAESVRKDGAAAYYDLFGDAAGAPQSRINLFFLRERGCVPAP